MDLFSSQTRRPTPGRAFRNCLKRALSCLPFVVERGFLRGDPLKLPLFKQSLRIISALLWLSLAVAPHSTAKSIVTPASPATDRLVPALISAPAPQPRSPASEPPGNVVTNAVISAIPSSDGTAVFISVAGVALAGGPIVLNIDPGTGPGGHEGSYAMPISGTTHIATAIGFAPGLDVGGDGDDTLSITTTVGSGVVSTGPINFQRAFVEKAQIGQAVVVDSGAFVVDMPNSGTVPTDAYLMVMSTNAPPGPLPPGYRFSSSTYSLSPSGALPQSERFMTLKLSYDGTLPTGADPHTLAIVGCDLVCRSWDVLGGDLFDSTDQVIFYTKRFRVYALATTPTWRDSFTEETLTGVLSRENTEPDLAGAIVLSTSATSGTVTSIPIAPPTGAAGWGTLHFSATTALDTSLRVDVLDQSGSVVLADASDGADLSGLPLAAHPNLTLRATLTSAQAGQTPWLHDWSLEWVVGQHIAYLPLLHNGGQ
jgi:hypothetical protein